MTLNYRKTILIGLAFFSICAFWQLYDTVIPLILSKTFGLKETFTGVIMALDNILGLFLLPLFGSISDRTHTRLGKRIPFIAAGTAVAVLFMLLIPFADNSGNFLLLLVALGVILVAMGTYRSPSVALMPDVTPKPLRSRGNAVINLMGAIGGIYTLSMISFLVPKEGKPDYTPLFASVCVLMIVSVSILVLTIKENELAKENALINASLADENDASNSEKEAPLPPDVKKSLIMILASIFFWFTSYNAVTTAFSRYAVNVWGLKGGSYASALIVTMVSLTLSFIPAGIVSTWIGRKKTIMIGILIITVSFSAAFFFVEYSPLIFIIFALCGIGWACINVNSYPMVVEMSRGSDVGKYTGLYYTFSMSAQIITPVISGALIEFTSYRSLFPYSVAFSLISLYTMTKVKHGDAKPVRKGNPLDSFGNGK